MEYYVGQIFEEDYPPEAADFCNNSQDGEKPCYIREIEPLEGIRRFQIVPSEKLTETEIANNRIMELENYLNSTDWYAVRYTETGVEIPGDVRQQRQSAREEISSLREQIKTENE